MKAESGGRSIFARVVLLILPTARLPALGRTQSNQSLFFSGPFLAGTAASFMQDLSPPLPGTSIGGTDLLNRANLSYTGIAPPVPGSYYGVTTRPQSAWLDDTQLAVTMTIRI